MATMAGVALLLPALAAWSPPTLPCTVRPRCCERGRRPKALLEHVAATLPTHLLAGGPDPWGPFGGLLEGIAAVGDSAAAKLGTVQANANSMSETLTRALDAGSALRQNELSGLSILDRDVITVLEDVTEGGVEGLSRNAISATSTIEKAVMDSIGHDMLVFLGCASVAAPLARVLKVTPILTYLLFGALLGPHCLDVFTSTGAAVELGDFGILFLLFIEGLEVTSERLGQLATFVPLGLAQVMAADCV
jgi:hypothetical protein